MRNEDGQGLFFRKRNTALLIEFFFFCSHKSKQPGLISILLLALTVYRLVLCDGTFSNSIFNKCLWGWGGEGRGGGGVFRQKYRNIDMAGRSFLCGEVVVGLRGEEFGNRKRGCSFLSLFSLLFLSYDRIVPSLEEMGERLDVLLC